MTLITKNSSFVLFGTCILVKGYYRYAICDVQRNKFVCIPKEIGMLFSKNNRVISNKKIDYIGKENIAILSQYLHFLEEKNYGFFNNSISEKNGFVEIDKQWDFPSKISNVVIFAKKTGDCDKLLQKIKDYPITHVVIVFLIKYHLKILIIACYSTNIQISIPLI